MSSEYSLLGTDVELVQACETLSKSAWLAIDTEFERVRTYYPEVCLIQIASESGTFIIDPLSIRDLTPLFDLLYDKSITKIFHAARQDIEIFFNTTGEIPAPIFDTQIAARFLEHGDQIGYANLVNAMLEVELEKAYTRINWKKRPLQKEHLQYAADDVIYLAKLYPLLCEKTAILEKENLDAFNQQLKSLENKEVYVSNPDVMWKKIYEAKKYRGKKLAVIKKLASWREIMAREENQPRKWFMPDQAILNIANILPEEIQDLERINVIDKKMLRRHGDKILAIVSELNQETE